MPFLLIKNSFQNIWRQLIVTLLVATIIINITSAEVETSTNQQTTTFEPDASPGCKAPDIRISVFKPEITTEQPLGRFDTTQGYFPEGIANSDVDINERVNIDLIGPHFGTQMGVHVSPHQISINRDHHVGADITKINEQNDGIINEYNVRRRNKSTNRLNLNRRKYDRHQQQYQLQNENKPTNEPDGRYKRQSKINDNFRALHGTGNHTKLVPGGYVYYIRMEDIFKSPLTNNHIQFKLYQIKNADNTTHKILSIKSCENEKYCVKSKKFLKQKDTKSIHNGTEQQFHYQSVVLTQWNNSDNGHTNLNAQEQEQEQEQKQQQQQQQEQQQEQQQSYHHGAEKYFRRHRENYELKIWNKDFMKRRNFKRDMKQKHKLFKRGLKLIQKYKNDKNEIYYEKSKNMNESNADNLEINKIERPPLWRTKEVDDYAHLHSISKTNVLKRVKRKSGKTTGALSRPKGGSDSGSKTATRKDKPTLDEETGYPAPHETSIESEEEEEEEEEIDILQKFREVSEIQFPGEIGPVGDLRLCKLRCINGKWMGPLCATNEEDKNGNVKFQPLYKSCHVQRIPQYLLLSYRNISVNVGWDVPHGHSLQARCKDLGMYKLLGESRVLCSDGLWAPRMPSCVPTTLLTNFSDDSAPSIRYHILNGSGSFEPSGVLAVLPQSSIFLDCLYPRSKGIPEWTWTSWYMQYPTGWASEDRNLRYRLTIRDIENGDTGTFTCTSPRGLTNSISIVVTTSTCPRLPIPPPPLSLHLEGNKLGQHALYRCPPGYRVDGIANVTCLASGNWSSQAPTCHAIQCPRLVLNDPHLSVVELNTSAWGRVVFKCQWGFKLNGPPTLECEPSGVWNGQVPRCKAIQCPMPVPPLNGRIGGTNVNQRRFTVGALITFSCNEGHTLVGEPSIICTENGFWSHSPPFCKSQCPYPGDPPNGLLAPLKFSYDSGDYISVQCRPGYIQFSENGPPERPKCLPDGNWSGPVPKCRSYEDV